MRHVPASCRPTAAPTGPCGTRPARPGAAPPRTSSARPGQAPSSSPMPTVAPPAVNDCGHQARVHPAGIPVPGQEPHVRQQHRIGPRPDLVPPAAGGEHLPGPGQRVRDPGNRQLAGGLDVDHAYPAVTIGQHEVRHVPPHPPARRGRHQERLRRDRRHLRVEVRQQQPRQLQAALIHHVPAGRRRPVPARVMRLPLPPPEHPPRPPGCQLLRPHQRQVSGRPLPGGIPETRPRSSPQLCRPARISPADLCIAGGRIKIVGIPRCHAPQSGRNSETVTFS